MALVGCFAAVDWIRAAAAVAVGVDRLLLLLALLVFALVIPGSVRCGGTVCGLDRRRIARQLNKGENLHALPRTLAYAGAGAVRRRHHEQQSGADVCCLTLATNSIVRWSTEYHGLAVGPLRAQGRDVDDEVLAHIWPEPPRQRALLRHALGRHRWELAKLDADDYRPLRLAAFVGG